MDNLNATQKTQSWTSYLNPFFMAFPAILNPGQAIVTASFNKGAEIGASPKVQEKIAPIRDAVVDFGENVINAPGNFIRSVGETVGGAAKGVGDFALSGLTRVAIIGVVGLIGFVVISKTLGKVIE